MKFNSKNKKEIFMIDDDEVHLSTAELFLKDEYELRKAMSGEEALAYLSENKFVPDLIMLDIVMPNMNGWEVFKKIREMKTLKDVPILFLTSHDGAAERKRAREIGAVDYVTKPFNMTLLKSALKNIFDVRNK